MTEATNINSRLIAVQSALKAPKGQYNKFGGYKYRSCEDILEAVKPLLAEQGLTLTLTDEVLDIGGWHYVQATATVSDGSDSVSCRAYARESETKKGMDASQITGTKDADATQGAPEKPQKPSEQDNDTTAQARLDKRIRQVSSASGATPETIKGAAFAAGCKSAEEALKWLDTAVAEGRFAQVH